MPEELLTPENVTRLWAKARPYLAMSDDQVAGLSEAVVRGMTVEELERPRPAQDAPRPVADPDDAVEHYERFE